MFGSVSTGRKQLSSKHVVQPEERRLLGGISTGQHTLPFKGTATILYGHCTLEAE